MSEKFMVPGVSKGKPPVPTEYEEAASLCAATDVVIGGRSVLGIGDARALHEGLGVRRDYATWIKGRIAKYGFREGVDFELGSRPAGSIPQNGGIGENQVVGGGMPLSVYRLTLDMAKELAMVENNDRGRTIRRYYIWLEQQTASGGDLVRRTDGISRMLAKKVTGLERNIELLAEQVRAMVINNDPRRSAVTHVAVRTILEEARAIQKGRGKINRKIGFELRVKAAIDGVAIFRCPYSAVWLFPRDLVLSYMAERGNAIVAKHNAAGERQGVLTLFKRPSGPGVRSIPVETVAQAFASLTKKDA